MNLLAMAINAAERVPLSDGVTLTGIDFLCARTKRRLRSVPAEAETQFVERMRAFPIAAHADKANEQHYELPAEFFTLVLGPRRKYSSCLYPSAQTSLAEAEVHALNETVRHAQIEDGMDILELGCGWGSLSLHLAQTFPNARITSVSNSASQRAFILSEAAARGLDNLEVITADMNAFEAPCQYHRVVSVEMFEHMSNWRSLLGRTKDWLRPEAKLFLHVFTHRDRSYRFDEGNPADWIAHHFFTGGIMPASDLPHRFEDLFAVEHSWRWSGLHYQRTAMHWLANFDSRAEEIRPILRQVYGQDARLWERRWRLFFLATAGLFGHDGGDVWGVGHYLMTPVA